MPADMRVPKKLNGTLAGEGKSIVWDGTRRRPVWGPTLSQEGAYELPGELPEIPLTPDAQDIADVLVALGLATQAEA